MKTLSEIAESMANSSMAALRSDRSNLMPAFLGGDYLSFNNGTSIIQEYIEGACLEYAAELHGNAPRPAATAIKIEAFNEAQNACSQFLESDATHNEKHIAVNISIRGCQQAIEQLKKG